jgi:hypothetical protein
MGALKYAAKVEAQREMLHQRYQMKWYHEFLWLTVGKATSYLMNPYRSPFFEGLLWEFRIIRAQLRGTSSPKQT